MDQDIQNKFTCIKVKFPTRAFPGFHLVQYGLQSAIQNELSTELTDSADVEPIRGVNGQPHIVLFKEENAPLQLKNLCCKPDLINETLHEGETAGTANTNRFYEKMEPIFFASHPLGKADEVISNLEKGHIPFACVVHLETEIYTDKQEKTLRMRINSKKTDITALFMELSNHAIDARFSLNVKKEEQSEHLEMHEKIKMAADMLSATLGVGKKAEVLDDKIFCVLDDFLGESLSKHLEEQIFHSMQKAQKIILEKLNRTAEMFGKIKTELVRCENGDEGMMQRVLENSETKLKTMADNFKYAKTECNEDGIHDENESARAFEYKQRIVKNLSRCLIEEIVHLLKKRREKIYTAICERNGLTLYYNLLEEEIDDLIPGNTPKRYEQIMSSLQQRIERCFSTNTIHCTQTDICFERWKCQESVMLYEKLWKHKTTQREIISLFKVDIKTPSEKLNSAYDAMVNLQQKIDDIKSEMKEPIPLSLQMIARRLSPVKGIAVIQGKLGILVDTETLEDKIKRREILKVVTKYNKNHFEDVTEATFMKHFGKGNHCVRQGSKIIRHDGKDTRYGTLACLGKMNGAYDVGITNDHVALPGSKLSAYDDNDEIPLGMASGQYNIDTTVKFRHRMMDFSAFAVKEGIFLERRFFNKTHDIAISQVFRKNFEKLAKKRRPQLYFFGGTSEEPKCVEYVGSLTTDDLQVDLVKATVGPIPETGDSGSLICQFDAMNSTIQAILILIGSCSDEPGMYLCCRLGDCLDYLKHYRQADITFFSSPSGSSLRVLTPRQ